MNQRKRAGVAAVPVFSLYGEAAASPDLEFVHLEHIATRSQRYDWEIDSHAHRDLFQVLFLFGGGAQVRLDDQSFEVLPPAAIVIPAAAVHAFRFQPGTQGYVLTVAESLLSGAEGAQGTLFEPLRAEAHVVELAEEKGVAASIAGLLGQLFDEFRRPRHGRSQMLDWLARAVMLLVARQMPADPLPGGERGRAELFARFRELVEEHYAGNWTVSRYAAALNLTANRLNRLSRTMTGKSAFDVAQDRLLLEARRKLFYIAAPVSQLAYELGFADPAYFCRFFKKKTGMAPSEFRRQAR
jgi:AraC family transcriptional regulator, transcriptional activator of pobA